MIYQSQDRDRQPNFGKLSKPQNLPGPSSSRSSFDQHQKRVLIMNQGTKPGLKIVASVGCQQLGVRRHRLGGLRRDFSLKRRLGARKGKFLATSPGPAFPG